MLGFEVPNETVRIDLCVRFSDVSSFIIATVFPEENSKHIISLQLFFVLSCVFPKTITSEKTHEKGRGIRPLLGCLCPDFSLD